VYKTKFNSDDTIDRHKVRLIAQGFTQTFGVDYKETFALIAKMNIVRVLLSIVVNSGLMCQMDVKNTFLHGNLEEEVCMKLPPGHLQASDPTLVCRLHKSLHGLKQSSHAWHAQLSVVLEELGFKMSNADSSLFVHIGPKETLVVLIYVDDLIISGNNSEAISHLKATSFPN